MKLRYRPPDYVGDANMLGNQRAHQDNMSPDAHKKRIQGLFKSWGNFERTHTRGERIMRARPLRPSIGKKAVRKRLKLKETLAKEAREIQEIARRHSASAMEVICTIAADENARDSDRLAASLVIIERGYGKANQTNINANLDANGKTNEVSATELDQRIEATLSRVEAITGGEKKAPEGKERPADIRERDPDTGSSSIH